MRLKINLLILLSIFLYNAQAQNDNFVAKTNILYGLTGTLNAGIEYKISDNVSTEFSANLNPWNYGNWKIEHFIFQPEIRYWFKKTYSHAFLGAHLLYSYFDFGGFKFPLGIYGGFDLNEFRYEGTFYGIGVGPGYQWYFNRSWGMEASLGIGYTHWSYNKHKNGKNGAFLEQESGGLFSLTKINLSLVYRIRD